MVARVSRAGEDGQGLAEYALILAFIAMAVVVALGLVGTSLNDFFNMIAEEFAGLI